MQPDTRKRVLIAYPTMGWNPHECSTYREQLAYQLGKWEGESDCPYSFEFGQVSDVIVQLARETIAQAAVENGFDFVCMMDDDMLGYIKGEGYENIWRRLLAHDVDVVAALAFMRAKPHYPVCFALRGGWDEIGAQERIHTENIKNYPKDRLFECDAVGMGAVCIKTEVFRKVPKPWFMSTNPTGEDILFCRKAARHGFRIFMDTATKLKHLMPRSYVGEEEYELLDKDVHTTRKFCGDWSRDKAKENMPS